MTFAAVLAICFKPLVGTLQRQGLKPSLAAGLVVLGLLALAVGVFTATAKGVIDQADQIGELADQAIDKAADESEAARRRQGGARGRPCGDRGGRAGGRRGRPHPPGRPVRLGARPGQRHDPRLADHVLPAQGRQRLPAGRGRQGEPGDPGRRRRLHRRLLPLAPQLRQGPQRHVGRRLGGDRRRQPADGPPDRLHDHGGELRRRLHPLHRRLPRRRPGRDRRPRRRRDRPGRARCS